MNFKKLYVSCLIVLVSYSAKSQTSPLKEEFERNVKAVVNTGSLNGSPNGEPLYEFYFESFNDLGEVISYNQFAYQYNNKCRVKRSSGHLSRS